MIPSAAFVGTKRTFVALKGYRHTKVHRKNRTFKIIVLINQRVTRNIIALPNMQNSVDAQCIEKCKGQNLSDPAITFSKAITCCFSQIIMHRKFFISSRMF